MIMKWITIGLFVLMLQPISAQEKTYFASASIGIQMNIWKPSTLDDQDQSILTSVSGSEPAFGFFITSPAWQGISFRGLFFQWQQRRIDETSPFDKILVRQVSFDIKQQIIPIAPASPYVTLGISTCFTRSFLYTETSLPTFQRQTIGFNLGAGIDVHLFEHFALAMEYQYLYAKFNRTVGYTDNYSGPNLSAKLAYLF